MKNTITVLLGGLLAVLPQAITTLPHGYAELATAVIAVLSALYHLFQPAPQ